ncbi:MAG TPA: response regulator, partial [Thermoanaerobaculia bacterium]|nr:response regulator [Thermoanaerobaculia bacterium]
IGEIRGLDPALWAAVGRLALLFGGTFFMVRGIADLRERRLQVSDLVAEKNARLDELHRLAAELDQRTRELGEANLRIQEANRAKSQFLANMSHELRTPLNSIIGFSEILSDRLGGRIEPRYEKFLANILGSGQHLLELINNILDLSKIEAGKMELVFEAVSPADLVHGVQSVMVGMASQRGIRLDAEIPSTLPPIVVDPPRVKQILYNLTANAIKFSPPESRIVLRARELTADESPLAERAIELSVSDQGEGIRTEDQQLIFEEFRQVDGGTTRNMGGTGLGLALVKRFAEMHGGVVTVESELGRGSTFRVFLPLDASLLSGPRRLGEPLSFSFAIGAVQDALGSGRRILVAEDDDEFVRVFAADLEAAGYVVERARTGDEALEMSRRRRPDAITLDLVLPGRDGWEVLRELKSDPATADIPVIIVSLVDNHELGFALGAADYFVKPLDRQRFLSRLRSIVRTQDAGSPASVLIVDDDPQVHDYLGEEIERAGYRLISARSGSEGVALAAAHRPSVIVLDLIMEGMDGFQAAAELSRREETRSIPVLVYTARELDAEDRRRLTGRMTTLLQKSPADSAAVIGAIRRLAGPMPEEARDAPGLGG